MESPSKEYAELMEFLRVETAKIKTLINSQVMTAHQRMDVLEERIKKFNGQSAHKL